LALALFLMRGNFGVDRWSSRLASKIMRDVPGSNGMALDLKVSASGLFSDGATSTQSVDKGGIRRKLTLAWLRRPH